MPDSSPESGEDGEDGGGLSPAAKWIVVAAICILALGTLVGLVYIGWSVFAIFNGSGSGSGGGYDLVGSEDQPIPGLYGLSTSGYSGGGSATESTPLAPTRETAKKFIKLYIDTMVGKLVDSSQSASAIDRAAFKARVQTDAGDQVPQNLFDELYLETLIELYSSAHKGTKWRNLLYALLPTGSSQ